MSWHTFWHPHCEHCLERERELRACPSCDTLKTQLELMHVENRKLTDALIARGETPAESPAPEVKPQPLSSKAMPWATKRAMLEAQDRAKAQTLREYKEREKEAGILKSPSVEDLEKELNITLEEELAHG